jgi:hypothetical protein
MRTISKTHEPADFFHIHDGLIRHDDAFIDGMSVPRQIGVLPEHGPRGDRLTKALFDLKAALRPHRRRTA